MTERLEALAKLLDADDTRVTIHRGSGTYNLHATEWTDDGEPVLRCVVEDAPTLGDALDQLVRIGEPYGQEHP